MNAHSAKVGHDIASAQSFGRLVDYPVVDTEAHVFIRCWPIETNPHMSAVDPFTRAEHSGDVLLAEMDRCGVDLAILIGYDGYDFKAFMDRYQSVPADFMGGRAYSRAWALRHPHRLKYVTTLHDRRAHADALEELVDELERGAVGAKIFPAYLNLTPDAPEIRAAFDILRDTHAAAVFGLEDTIPPATPSLTEMYEALGRLAVDYPDVPIQLNHGANADTRGAEIGLLFDVVNSCPHMLVSTSVLGGVMMEWKDGWRYPFDNYLRHLSIYIEGLNPEKLAWGTDWPWLEGVVKYPQLLQTVVDHALFASESDRSLYLGGNALRHWDVEGEVVFLARSPDQSPAR